MTGDPEAVPRPRRTCPICGRPPTTADAPFCSSRCADVDLHRWMSGVYAVPAITSDEEETAIGPAGERET